MYIYIYIYILREKIYNILCNNLERESVCNENYNIYILKIMF